MGAVIDAADTAGIDAVCGKSEAVVDVRCVDSLVEILCEFRIAVAGEVREDVAEGHLQVGRGGVCRKLKTVGDCGFPARV